jgi:hypothetical protein
VDEVDSHSSWPNFRPEAGFPHWSVSESLNMIPPFAIWRGCRSNSKYLLDMVEGVRKVVALMLNAKAQSGAVKVIIPEDDVLSPEPKVTRDLATAWKEFFMRK